MKALFALATCLLLLAMPSAISGRSISAQEGQGEEEPSVLVVAYPDKLGINEEFRIEIQVENVRNLAAFQFILGYDPSVVGLLQDDAGLPRVEVGPFLGSGDRQVTCPDKTVTSGSVTLRCVTLNPPVSMGGPEGPSGSGILTSMFFQGLHEGESDLELQRLILLEAEVDAEGYPVSIPAVAENTVVSIGSDGAFSWSLWGPVVGIVVFVLAATGAAWFVRSRRARRIPEA